MEENRQPKNRTRNARSSVSPSKKQKDVIICTDSSPELLLNMSPKRKNRRKANQAESRVVYKKRRSALPEVSTPLITNSSKSTSTDSSEEENSHENIRTRSKKVNEKLATKIQNSRDQGNLIINPSVSVSSSISTVSNNRRRRISVIQNEQLDIRDTDGDIQMVLEIGETEATMTTIHGTPKRNKSDILNPTRSLESSKTSTPSETVSTCSTPKLLPIMNPTQNSQIFVFPPNPPRKRKLKSNASNESSDSEIEVVEGFEDFQNPVFYLIPNPQPHNYSQKTKNPLSLLDYMRRSTFMRIRVNERKFFERIFRAFLLAQFDTGFNKSEFLSLNSEDVQSRLRDYYPKPIDQCLACEKAGKIPFKNPALDSCTSNTQTTSASSMNTVDTKPHMKYSNVEQGYGVEVNFHNPLYRKGIARLPDLRLVGFGVRQCFLGIKY